MNKTKVRLTPDLLDYRQSMAQLVHEARQERLRLAETFDDTIEPYPASPDITPTDQAGLLTPPRIASLWPEIYLRDGETFGIIQINTLDVFGVLYVYITLKDELGNPLESGCAMRNEICEGHWGYVPSVPLTVGTTVVVRAVAVDALGGMGIAQEKVTVTDGCPGSADLVVCGDNR
jgi:hypothetical protein